MNEKLNLSFFILVFRHKFRIHLKIAVLNTKCVLLCSLILNLKVNLNFIVIQPYSTDGIIRDIFKNLKFFYKKVN